MKKKNAKDKCEGVYFILKAGILMMKLEHMNQRHCIMQNLLRAILKTYDFPEIYIFYAPFQRCPNRGGRAAVGGGVWLR